MSFYWVWPLIGCLHSSGRIDLHLCTYWYQSVRSVSFNKELNKKKGGGNGYRGVVGEGKLNRSEKNISP